MGKKLINKNHLQDLYCRESMTFLVDKNMILSQSALDFSREYQIKLIYSRDSNSSNPPRASIKKTIGDILKKDYGIEDDKIIKMIIDKINQK